MYSLTCQAISPPMWEALPLIAQVFEVSIAHCGRVSFDSGGQHLLAEPRSVGPGAVLLMQKTKIY